MSRKIETNKCIPISEPDLRPFNPDLDPFKVSKDSRINNFFEYPMIMEQIRNYLDSFWCEHGQLKDEILSCNISDLEILENKLETFTSPMSLRAMIILRKKDCHCQGSLSILIDDIHNQTSKVRSETQIYPIPFRKKGVVEVGVDEVGRGCLLGPVTSGAVIWPPDLDNDITRRLIKDSKKLSEPQREEAYAYIIENAISWGVASLDNKEIDRTNILRAAIKTMHMAIDDTYIIPDHIIADGNSFNIYMDRNGDPVNHSTIIQGDSKYYGIAAASIIAKVTRDREMVQLEKDNPELAHYGISSNKGYGAPIHLRAIKTHGLTKWHRRSFNPCK